MKKKGKAADNMVARTISAFTDSQKAQENLDSLFNLVPELICIASTDGYFIKLNPAWETLLGFSIAELMSKPYVEFIHPDDVKPTYAEVEKQLQGKQTINFTNRYRCKNGGFRTLNWVAIPSPDQKLLYAAARDITESIAKENELLANEEKYHAFFENSMDAILLTSPEGGISEANKAACEMLGYTESELIGQGRNGIVDLTDPRLPVLLTERAKHGKARGELTLIKKGGLKFQSEVSSAFFTDINGFTRTIMIINDITERKLIENTYIARVRLLQFATNHSLDDLLEETINEAENLTGSQISFYHFIEEDKKSILLKNWSTRTKKDFCHADRMVLNYEIAKCGVWVDCIKARSPVIHNDYSSLPYKKGMPPGHAELVRELVVPVIRDGKIKAVLGVGNKPSDYNGKDTELVSILADLAWDIAERKLTEEALLKSEELLRSVINNAPLTIFATDEHGIFTLSEGKQLKSVNLKPGENVGLSAIDLFGSMPFVETTGKIINGSDLVQRVLKGETIVAFNKLGDINFENHLNPIRDTKGKVIGMLGIAIDITESKKAEDALRQSESRYRSLFDSSGTNIVIIDREGKYLMVNKGAADNFGKKTEEIVGKSMFDLLSPKEAQIYLEFNNQLFEKGGSREYEDTFTLSTGKKTFLIIDQCLKDAKGENVAIQSSSIEITDRKLVEEKLAESEKHYHTLFDAIDEGFCIVEVIFDENEKPVDYLFLEINPSFEKQTGLIDAKGKRMRELVPNHEEFWFETYGEIAITGKALRFENIAEQLHRWYNVYAFRVGQPEDRQVAILFNDITERKRTVLALQVSESKYRSLFESSLTGISSTDIEGKLIQINQAYAQMYGYDNPAQMIDEAPDVRQRYANIEDRSEIRQKISENGKIGPIEVEVVKRDGTKFQVLVTAHNVTDSVGNFQYNQAEHIDISELKKLEEELKQSRKEILELSLHIEQAHEKERAKIAMDLHDDLGQKLTALIMDLAWIKRKMPDIVPEISNKMSSMSDLLNETLLDIQKIAGGLRPSILDDLGLAAAIQWQIQKIIENTDLDFAINISPEELTLAPELSTLLFRIIQEALTNIVRHASATKVTLTLIKKSDLITLTIKDNGTGITELQIKSPVSFGLIGIRERIKTLCGTFTITGEHGKGTEIFIKIPLSN
jgi:PAS domain S-box-containing protein